MAGNKRHRTRVGGFRTTEDVPDNVSKPTFLSTFDRESHYPIFCALCDCLSIDQIISLTRTCKKLSGLYQYLIPVHWDVDKALRRYFDDPLGFRSQMARCDAIIEGSFPLRYFGRFQWGCEPLEVSIQQGPRVELFSKYLQNIAGYSEVKRTKYGWNTTRIESRIFQRMANDEIEIIFHVTRSIPVKHMLLKYTTTAINFLSWNKAYSVFPLPTFIQYKSYLLQPWHGESIKIASQHDSRLGWNVQGVMWPEEKCRGHPIRERRRVGDRYTWIIPFDTRKVEWSKTPDYVLEHACFTMDQTSDHTDEPYNQKWGDIRNYTIVANTLESKVLKYNYLYGDVGMRDFFFRRLHSYTILELHMLDPAQRPANYDEILANPGDLEGALTDFDPPASWRYRDGEFSKWYEAFEKQKSE